MVVEVLFGLGAGLVGYAIGRRESDDDPTGPDAVEDAYEEGWKEAQEHSDSLYAGDWDRGYNAGLEAGRLSTSPDPIALSHTATAVREARLPWILRQINDHQSTYRDLFWRLLEVARDVGDRYRKVESLGQAGLVPIGDALNVCVVVADVAKQYDDNRILTRPHQGVYEGKAS